MLRGRDYLVGGNQQPNLGATVMLNTKMFAVQEDAWLAVNNSPTLRAGVLPEYVKS